MIELGLHYRRKTCNLITAGNISSYQFIIALIILCSSCLTVLAAESNTYPCVDPINGIIADAPSCLDMNCEILETDLFITTDGKYLFPESFDKILTLSNNGTLYYYCYIENIRDYLCESSCLFNTSNRYTCTGDENYCSDYNCSSPATCYCSSVFLSEFDYIRIHNQLLQLNTIIKTNICIGKMLDINNKRGYTNDIEIRPTELKTNLFESNKISITNSNRNITLTILLQKANWQTAFNIVNKTYHEITIPDVCFDISGDLNLKVYLDSGLFYEENFYLIGRSTCVFTDCFYCWKAFDNFSCLPPSYKTGLVFITIILLGSFIIMCPAIVYLFYLVIFLLFKPITCTKNCCFGCLRTKFAKDASKKLKRKFHSINNYYFKEDPDINSSSTVYINKNGKIIPATVVEGSPNEQNNNKSSNKPNFASGVLNFIRINKNGFNKNKTKLNNNYNSDEDIEQSHEIEELIDDKVEERMQSKNTSSGRTNNNQIRVFKGQGSFPSLYIAIVCCSFIVTPTAAQVCSDGIVIPSTTMECTSATSTFESCLAEFHITATLQTPGLATCFTLTDENGEVVFTGFVEYIAMNDVITLSKNYYTSSWGGHSQSIHRCYRAGPCQSNSCNGPMERTASGQITNVNIVNYPGETICHSSCGCASCDGCFYCEPSCLYSAYGIKPSTAEYLEVNSLDQRKHQPILRFHARSAAGVDTNFTVTYNGIRYTEGGFSLFVAGNLAGDYTEFGTNKVIKQLPNNYFYLGNAAEPNAPQRGMVGDIQADTYASLTSTGQNAFKFDKTIVTRTPGDFSDAYLFAASGWNTGLPLATRFPLNKGGNLWFYKDGVLTSNVTDGGAVLFDISTPSKIRFIRTKNTVCPRANFLSASGCFNCEIGFAINCTLRSLCKDGAVIFQSSDPSIVLRTTSAIITTEDKYYIIYGSTPRSEVDFYLNIIGNGNSAGMSIKFTATAATTISNDTDYQNDLGDDGVVKESGSPFENFLDSIIPGFIGDLFGNPQSPFIKILIIIAQVILGVLAAVLLGFILYKVILFSVFLYKTKTPSKISNVYNNHIEKRLPKFIKNKINKLTADAIKQHDVKNLPNKSPQAIRKQTETNNMRKRYTLKEAVEGFEKNNKLPTNRKKF